MPTYAYACDTCGFAKDEWLKVSEALPELACPSCGKPTYRKQLTAPAFQLKGGGWYVTDFRNGGAPAKSAETEKSSTAATDASPATAAAATPDHPATAPTSATASNSTGSS